MREIVNYKTEQEWLSARLLDVTSTEAAALFGISPYLTHFELWHRKKEMIHVEFNENERTAWGKRLEDSIAKGVAEDNSWEVIPKKHYMRIPSLRIGSSFDYCILTDGKESGLIEVKNVDGLQFKNNWIVDESGNIEAPPAIELQLQIEMFVSGLSTGYIAALVGGNSVKLIKREPNDEVIEMVKQKVAAFWDSFERNEAPDPDFKRDADFIGSLYRYAEPGKVLDGSGNHELHSLISQYRTCAAQAKDYEEQKQAIKAQLLMMINDAEKVLCDQFTISAGITGPTRIEAFERKAFRNFRITEKKVK